MGKKNKSKKDGGKKPDDGAPQAPPEARSQQSREQQAGPSRTEGSLQGPRQPDPQRQEPPSQQRGAQGGQEGAGTQYGQRPQFREQQAREQPQGTQQRGSKQQKGRDQPSVEQHQSGQMGKNQQLEGRPQRGAEQQQGRDQPFVEQHKTGEMGKKQQWGGRPQRGAEQQQGRDQPFGEQHKAGEMGKKQQWGGRPQRGAEVQQGRDQFFAEQHKSGQMEKKKQADKQQRGADQQQGRGHQQGGQMKIKQSAAQQFGGQQPTIAPEIPPGDGKNQQRQSVEQPQRGPWGDKQSQRRVQPLAEQHDNGQMGKPKFSEDKQMRQQPGTTSPSIRSTSSSISSMELTPTNLERGKIGRPGSVGVNYVDIKIDKMPSTAYHYDVVISPDIPKKFLRPAFEQYNRQFFPTIQMAYDGKSSFYTIVKLPVQTATGEVEIDDRGIRKKSFKVTIKETQDSEIDLGSLRRYSSERVFDKPMRALQCLEVVLANPCHNKAVRAGRSFFMKPNQRYDLNDGYEMWIGLYQAAILGDLPFLNVDISHKSFPSECHLTEYLRNNCRDLDTNRPLEPRNMYGLKDFLKNVDIVYEPPAKFGSFPKRYKVIDVSKESAASLKVTLDNKVVVTVADYFKSKGYPLQYPNWNCLKVGSSIKSIHLPIELCKIPGAQALNKKDGPRQVQQMIKFSATSTDVRKEKIMTMLSYFKHNLDMKVQGFGIQIGHEFKVVPMRILKSPSLEYFACEMITPFKGAWRMNENTKFLKTKQVNNGHLWAVVYSDRSRISFSTINNFFGKVSDLAKKLNISLAPKPQIEAFVNINATLRAFKNKNYDLVFVIIPRIGTSYAQIKQEAELKVGMLTQCIMENTIERRNDIQTVSNILLKVNGKLNGTNHRVNPNNNISLAKVMFLGADVTHPSPDQKHIPSVVGVAASHDVNGACYNMQYRLQKSACEEIVDMESIFSHHLKVYYQYQKSYPNQIIYYRDGVSDGQFPKVRDIELRSIRSACKRAGCSPKLTCIIAIKRHHTRFFPQTPTPRDKFNNVEPGTVVDRVIVHPNEVQFFMVSHQSIQGTAKPTRYNVIVDDAKMDINDLQTLTYNLCHMFPRCNRVVSYPAPAYLAHLVAYRGRVYIEGESRFADPKKEYEKRLVNQDFMQNNPMYFI